MPGVHVDGICELTLQTRDRPGLTRFYVDVVGLELLSEEEDRTWLKVGDTARLGLWTPGAKEFGDRGGLHVHFALSVPPDGLVPLASRLRAAGVPVRGPVEHEGGDRSLYWEDPAGNVIEAWDVVRRLSADGMDDLG